MWTPEERGLFRYFNGAAEIWGDPLEVQRELYTHLGSPDEMLAAVRDPSPLVRLPAAGRLVAAARQAFGMAPFDPATGEGATEADVKAALEAFWACLGEKKKPPGSSPTSAPPSDSPPGP